MPNIKSAKKRLRQNEKARERNRGSRSAMRTSIKKVHVALEEGKVDGLDALLIDATKQIAKNGKRNTIHPRTAARLQSRLQKRVNKSTPAA